MELRKILASHLRQNILMELAKVREIRIMKLADNLKTTYGELNRNLLILQGEGIVTNDCQNDKTGQGKIRIVRLNIDNSKTILLLQVLKILAE